MRRFFWPRRMGVSRDESDRGGASAQRWGAIFESLIARRLTREPLAYITGHKEFWTLDFEVGPGVLVPRPETETLIEEALSLFPDRTRRCAIADLGAGTGALAGRRPAANFPVRKASRSSARPKRCLMPGQSGGFGGRAD